MAAKETRDDGNHHFHYNRDERLASREMSAGPAKDAPKGLLRRNRSLTIILLDIVIIVIMLLLFQFIFTPGRGSARVGEFRADLAAFRFEQQIYATVEIIRIRESDAPLSGEDSLVEIQFAGGDVLLDSLPTVVDGHITATTVLPDDGSDDGPPVTVELRLLGRSVTLITRPKK